MPKMKTHSSSSKKFKINGSGKIKRGHSFGNHLLSNKSSRSKAKNRYSTYISAVDEPKIKKLLPYK